MWDWLRRPRKLTSREGRVKGLACCSRSTLLASGLFWFLVPPSGSPAALSLASHVVSGEYCVHELGSKSQPTTSCGTLGKSPHL